jgi:hypothetical protein
MRNKNKRDDRLAIVSDDKAYVFPIGFLIHRESLTRGRRAPSSPYASPKRGKAMHAILHNFEI